MFTSSITTQHIFKTKNSSWELGERVAMYLKAAFKGHKDTSVACGSEGIVITVLNATIPKGTLDFINENLSKWEKEIAVEDKKKIKSDIVEIKKFLKTFQFPKIKSTYSHKDELMELVDTMGDLCEELKDSLNGEPNVCYCADLEAYKQLVNLIGQKKYKEAYKIYRSLDTCVRELIPDPMRELLNAGTWVK